MNASQMPIIYKRQTLYYPTPFVHQEMTKKATFYEKNKERVKCKIGLWFFCNSH